MQLVLSLFPGLDVLGMGFEQEGFCVVKGPDVLWGGDVRRFHPPAGVFDGVIGGPPCPAHSRLRHQILENGYQPAQDLVNEFERVVLEAEPRWWVMENVPSCPPPDLDGCQWMQLDAHWLGMAQSRRRIFYSNLKLLVPGVALESQRLEPAVTADPRPVPVAIGGSGKRKPGADLPKRSLAECMELQGLPKDLLGRSPFTMQGKRKLVGNAVPLPMAQAVARAVRQALS